MKNDKAIQHSEHKPIKHQNILILHCVASAYKQAQKSYRKFYNFMQKKIMWVTFSFDDIGDTSVF